MNRTFWTHCFRIPSVAYPLRPLFHHTFSPLILFIPISLFLFSRHFFPTAMPFTLSPFLSLPLPATHLLYVTTLNWSLEANSSLSLVNMCYSSHGRDDDQKGRFFAPHLFSLFFLFLSLIFLFLSLVSSLRTTWIFLFSRNISLTP